MFRSHRIPVSVILILLLGAWLRFHALAQDARFHPDEALYNTFARDAVLQGRWMLPGLLDKPPLMIYANALSMALVGAADNGHGVLDFPSVRVGEFAGRLPNTFVSILTLVVTYALAKRLYGQSVVFSPQIPTSSQTGGSQTLPYAPDIFLPLSTQWRGGRGVRIDVLALLLMSLSPFAIAFSATAFTDVFMTFWMLTALWMVTLDRWGAAGICLALGVASKQPAVFYLPLILAVGWQMYGLTWWRVRRFVLALALGIGLLLVWDFARNQATIWQVSSGRENYPNHLIYADEILPRLHIWLTYAGTMLGSGWLTGVLVTLGVMGYFRRVVSPVGTQHAASAQKYRRGWGMRSTDILLLYTIVYFLIHWWVAFNTFDRYLLPIVPLVAILAGEGIVKLRMWYTANNPKLIPHPSSLIPLLLLFALSLSAFDASEGRSPVGGDLGEHKGIDTLAAYLNSKPVATVIYDHWLGWELGYYMGVWNDKRRVYYPTPELLVRDALALDEIGARYFPVPTDVDASAWLTALQEAGFGVAEVYRLERFVVYELTPPRQ